MKQQKDNQDEGLKGNEKIEEAIQALQQESTQEQLAHTLTVIRRRMRENGQLIVAVEPSIGQEQLKLQAVQTSDGKTWWCAFTSFEEELKGADTMKSTFLSDIGKLFQKICYLIIFIIYRIIIDRSQCIAEKMCIDL